ncbi:hypothetical protein NFI96_004685 [Prochilodus magdalenae]|nr:hypothetical protein NFI96_004685 [Prochilodus magdalenae]
MSKGNKFIHGFLASMGMSISGLDYMKDLLEDVRAITSTNNHHFKRMKIAGIAMGLIGWMLTIVICFVPKWKVKTSVGSPTSFEGLWKSCVMQSTGQLECKVYESSRDVPADLEVARVLTLSSIFMAPLAFMNFIRRSKAYMYVARCIQDQASMENIMMKSGMFLASAGSMLATSLYWTTDAIVRDSNKSNLNETPQSGPGASLYVGYIATALLFFGGVLLICTSFVPERK